MSSDHFNQAILSQPPFSTLSAEALTALGLVARRRKYQRGQLVFGRGDKAAELYVVAAGTVKLSIVSSEGAELVIRYAGPGSLIGEVGVLGNRTRTADACAFEDIELLSVQKPELFKIFSAYPEVAAAFFECLCDRISSTTDQLEGLALFSLEARLAKLLLKLAQEQASSEQSTKPRLNIRFSQADIAGMISASRQQVNRAFKRLESNGAFTRSKGSFVLNIERLEQHILSLD